MTDWTIHFPAPADWLNVNRNYKRRPNDTIRAWRQATAVHARAAKWPTGLARVSVYATLHFTNRRRRDAHNYLTTVKACIDGLVDYGLIPDDQREHLRWTAITEGDPIAEAAYGPAGSMELRVVDETQMARQPAENAVGASERSTGPTPCPKPAQAESAGWAWTS